MNLEKSSWEEVIKIQSSYRIIKKNYALLNDDTSLIDTKVDYGIQVYGNIDSQGLSKKNSRERNIREDIKESLLLELKDERDKIINEAKNEVEKLKSDAKEDGYKEGFDRGLQDGFNQGLEEGSIKGLESGYSQGIENAKDEAKEIKRNAINLFQDAEREVGVYIDENRQRIIRLAGQMAESIIHSTIDTSSENMLQLIKPVIQQFKKVENVIISCNSKNYDYLRKSIYTIEKKYDNTKFTILEDENLEKNGCIIENDNQIIDLQIRKQLENIVNKLNNVE